MIRTAFTFMRRFHALTFALIALFAAASCFIPRQALAQAGSAPTPLTTSMAAPSTAATAAAPSAKPAAAKVDNPYGLDALWTQSDLVAKFVLVMLGVMSAASWYVIVVKMLEQHRIGQHGRAASKITDSAEGLRTAAEALPPVSPFRRVAAAGFDAVQKHTRLSAKVSLDDWIAHATDRAVERVQRKLQGGMAVLATVGSIAPFVGLFGTVWGIYHALTAIGIAGQASIDKVAGPVGESLIMTAIGLAVAVPAVLGYNWLLRRNKAALDELRDFGTDVHAVLLAAA